VAPPCTWDGKAAAAKRSQSSPHRWHRAARSFPRQIPSPGVVVLLATEPELQVVSPVIWEDGAGGSPSLLPSPGGFAVCLGLTGHPVVARSGLFHRGKRQLLGPPELCLLMKDGLCCHGGLASPALARSPSPWAALARGVPTLRPPLETKPCPDAHGTPVSRRAEPLPDPGSVGQHRQPQPRRAAGRSPGHPAPPGKGRAAWGGEGGLLWAVSAGGGARGFPGSAGGRGVWPARLCCPLVVPKLGGVVGTAAAVLDPVRPGQAGELGREEPNEVQPGQGQGPAPGEEQPQAPGQAGAELLESSSGEGDWECWGTTG